MKLLFHCCCGPCAVACVENLAASGVSPALFWYNPNIHPTTEYKSRRDSLIMLAKAKNLPLETVDKYGLKYFIKEMGGETEEPERCEICYRMRLTRTAAYAAERGYEAFSTSLLISPFQQHDLIRRLGDKLGIQFGVQFVYQDFRPLFSVGQTRARELGLYMQKYCGCIFSEAER